MSSVFVTRRLPEAGYAVLRESGVEFEVGQEDGERGLEHTALLAGVLRHDVLLCQLTDRVDREVLMANPSLRGVAQMAVGLDNVDVTAAAELGIPVGNTPGVLSDATADLTWALLLAVARRVPEAHRYTVEGRYQVWGPTLLLGAQVGPSPDGTRKTLGIVGFGRIGRAVARRAVGFDLDVLAVGRRREPIDDDPNVTFAPLHELLARSDFVSLHVPLTDATRHLIGAAELARMKESAFLINTTRGPVVDEAALVAALSAKQIAGAGLDVYEHEPALAPGLAEQPNAVLLPHLGSATRETRDRMASLAAEHAVRFARGE